MNPALSVIFFTTLSGAGYGMLFWWAMAGFGAGIGIGQQNHGTLGAWTWSFVGALIMITTGLLSSVFHLGKPQRAWRAFSQWRTSWLSREGIASIATYAVAAPFMPAIMLGRVPSINVFTIGVAICSLGTVYCTAMIYASLKPVPAWRHWLVVPVYFVFAMQTGGWICTAVYAIDGDPSGLRPEAFVIVSMLTVLAAAMKLVYWRVIDRIELPSRESATALEGIGTVTTFERPHTEANYLTREMGFVLARKHSGKLRIVALLLFAGIPMLTMLFAVFSSADPSRSPPVGALWVAALSALLGAFVERWLFFAEAKHMVMLYY